MFSSLQNGGLFLLSYTELARAECAQGCVHRPAEAGRGLLS